jgi:hypothetical protein
MAAKDKDIPMDLIIENEPPEVDEAEPVTSKGPQPLTEDQIESACAQAIRDAVDFIDKDIAPDRLKARRYIDGEVDIGEEEGRTKIVVTKVRDTIRAVKPSLLRVFLNNRKPVEFLPNAAQEADMADQQTKYVSYLYRKNGGYLLSLGIIDDALKSKFAITKAYADDSRSVTHHYLDAVNRAQLEVIKNDPELTILAMSPSEEQPPPPVPGPDGMMPEADEWVDLEVQRTVTKRRPKIDLIPPENFFCDSGATDISRRPFCVGHVEEMPVGDAVAMGFDYDVVSQLDGLIGDSSTRDQEDEQRRKYLRNKDTEEATVDKATKKIAIYCAYIQLDIEGTGELMTYEVFMGGSKLKLLSYEPVDDNPFAIHEIDPDPHALHGNSLADLIMQDQDTSTSIFRGIVDNIHATNSPRLGVVEAQVNMDDVLNNELGGIIRTLAPGMIQSVDIPFTAGQALGVLSYHDTMVEQKTGVTRASMGLNADALQSTTKSAADNTVAMAAGQVEVMARNLAETGMVRLFQQLLKLSIETATGDEIMEVNGAFYPVDVRSWNADKDMQVNVGLGTGDVDRKVAALTALFTTQMSIWTQYGPQNGVVTLTGMHNALVDLVELQGIHNTARYITPMTPEREAQIMQAQQQLQQAQQAQGGGEDPTVKALVAGEQIKAQAGSQNAVIKAQVDLTREQMKDDRERDRAAQDFALSQAELQGKFGLQANEMRLRAETERQRNATQNQGPTQ